MELIYFFQDSLKADIGNGWSESMQVEEYDKISEDSESESEYTPSEPVRWRLKFMSKKERKKYTPSTYSDDNYYRM